MKKRILIVIYALLLCVTASFAWLSNFQANHVNEINVDFSNGALNIVNLDFNAYIETRTESGSFERIPDGEMFSFDHKRMVPDSITPFRIKIKNNSTTESRKAKLAVAIRLKQSEVGNVNLLDMLYLDVVAGDGFSETNNYHVFVKLNTADLISTEEEGEYLLYVYGDGDEIIIPPTSSAKEYVTLDCSLYFDQNATAEYQNEVITAMTFRLE
jgi:hypothetical protein